MPRATHSIIVVTGFALSALAIGCQPMVPMHQLHASQRTSRHYVTNYRTLSTQHQAVSAERDQFMQMSQSLETAKQTLAQKNAQLESELQVANARVSNLLSERGQLQERYASMLQEETGGLSGSLAERFQDLADRFPDLDFDPHTGMSRFNAEILFDSGSANLKSTAMPLLKEFASVLTDGEAQNLKILVVGHTDDKRIAQKATQVRHATNWHLSTNRANAVVLALRKLGIDEDRLGAMGYSRFQPVTENYDDQARQMNRRVEIYVLAPDALIAQWDPRLHRS